MTLVQKALEFTEKEPQYRILWIVFDKDQVKNLDEIICDAQQSGVGAGWSNPCFEIWLYAYFGEMPVVEESTVCCERFAEKYEKIRGQKYLKNDSDIYRKMERSGNFDKAVEQVEKRLKQFEKNSIELPSKMCPGCTMQRLVGEIRRKIGE